jgi:hypothetical protein
MATASALATPVPDRTSVDTGTWLVIAAGVGMVAYGLMFLVRNLAGFTELGLTPAHVGGTPDQIRDFSPHLYNYISHLQVAVAGFITAIGVGVISLAWNGIRAGMRWAAWTAFAVPILALAIGLPLHYTYGIATMGHLGLIYLDGLLLLAGTVLSLRAIDAPRSPSTRGGR